MVLVYKEKPVPILVRSSPFSEVDLEIIGVFRPRPLSSSSSSSSSPSSSRSRERIMDSVNPLLPYAPPCYYCENPSPTYVREAQMKAHEKRPDLYSPYHYMFYPYYDSPEQHSFTIFDHNSIRNYRKPPRLGNLPEYIRPGSVSTRTYSILVQPEKFNLGPEGYHTGVPEYNHEIVFRSESWFSVDEEDRDPNDKKNLPLLESLNNEECPEEFWQPGRHNITVCGRLPFDQKFTEMQIKQKELLDHRDMRGVQGRTF